MVESSFPVFSSMIHGPRVYIESLGLVTPVGLTVAQTMGSVRAGLNFFEEGEFFAAEGEPQVVAEVPFAERLLGIERQIALLGTALLECAAAPPLRRDGVCPLILCLPENPGVEFDFAELLRRVQAETQLQLATSLSVGVQLGRAGLGRALEHAAKLLASRSAPACYLAGVDSLLHRDRLVALQHAGRLKGPSNSDGLIPGEAGVCLRLSSKPGPERLAEITGSSVTQATGLAGRALAVEAQVAAARSALAQASCTMDDISLLASDVTGERAAHQERALAMARLAPRREPALDDWSPAFAVGDCGAAAGPLAIAYLAHRQSHGSGGWGHALWMGASDGGLRASAVVSPVV